ncbi:nitroreductase family protein [Paenibacillus sp. J2TS4]|uniref:nitroreductase family protein n=1 Tax=Paenibacillus sp. J2TS4 TaxID=2807194 RepID=UPI001B1A62F1|nr:nitroreductase family protein [Paenibacillus sp. J2TS4]GIP32641.1 nitroreductase [Paenibacillus sp. J2TS4]
MMDKLLPEVAAQREADYEIDPVFLNRWSPRAFANRPVEDSDLYGVLEAARWAPSGSNEQPWRFIVAKTPEQRELFLSFINPFNREWCHAAPVLLLLISKQVTEEGKTVGSHAFDAGTAWGYLALEATRRGLSSHAMGGFNKEEAMAKLQVSADYAPQVVIALGYRGDEEQLAERNRIRETPNTRMPLAELVMEGRFSTP